FRSQLLGEDVRYRVHGALGRRVYRRCGWRNTARGRADVNNASALGTEQFRRFLGRQNKSQYIGIEVPVELLFRDLLERRKLVDAGVIHQYVELSKGSLCLGEE